MKFRLFRFPVQVSWTFFVMAGFLAWQREDLALIAMWILVAFVSILVHELGHAVVARAYGAAPAIFLHYMGGHTSFALSSRRHRGPTVLISFAGPVAGFLFGGIVYAAHTLSGAFSLPLFSVLYRDLLWVNLGWGLINLLPTLPLDGGHILEALVRPARRVVFLSFVVSVVVAALGLWRGQLWVGVLFGLFAYSHFTDLRAMPRAPSQRLGSPPVFPRSRSSEPDWAREARRRAKEHNDGGA